MARVQIIFEGRFIQIVEYSNICAHHWQNYNGSLMISEEHDFTVMNVEIRGKEIPDPLNANTVKLIYK